MYIQYTPYKSIHKKKTAAMAGTRVKVERRQTSEATRRRRKGRSRTTWMQAVRQDLEPMDLFAAYNLFQDNRARGLLPLIPTNASREN